MSLSLSFAALCRIRMRSPAVNRPARFRQTRVLIVGCGDVGLRVAKALLPRCRVLALTSQVDKMSPLRQAGLVPLCGNLDRPSTLFRLAGLAQRVVHLAPPPLSGVSDPRTQNLLRALSMRGQVHSLVYGSTTGVYGDTQGARFDETRPVAPSTPRAHRRVHAEGLLRKWGQRRTGRRVSLLRIPGIYAVDRIGGHPRDRVLKGAPVLNRSDDVYTNHIQADDLARACVAALWRGRPGRVTHVSDDQEMLMGDYFDSVADLCGLPRPPRVSRAQAEQLMSPMQMSFLSESRRLINTRLKQELRLQLRCPTVHQGLGASVLGLNEHTAETLHSQQRGLRA